MFTKKQKREIFNPKALLKPEVSGTKVRGETLWDTLLFVETYHTPLDLLHSTLPQPEISPKTPV